MSQFPEISISGGSVDPQACIEPGTGRLRFLAFVVAIFGTLFGILASYGILLVVLLVYPLMSWYFHKKATAMLHGSGVRVGEGQFAEIHRCVETFRERLGIAHAVEVYIVEASVMNAAAIRYGKRHVVLLTDDLIHGSLASGNAKSLAFVLAHELAHIALGHTTVFRSWISQFLKKLGRLDEYSADAVAIRLVGNREIAFQGLLMLTVGYALLPFVNLQSINSQIHEVAADKYSKKAENSLTHPLLLNRLHRVLQST